MYNQMFDYEYFSSYSGLELKCVDTGKTVFLQGDEANELYDTLDSIDNVMDCDELISNYFYD